MLPCIANGDRGPCSDCAVLTALASAMAVLWLERNIQRRSVRLLLQSNRAPISNEAIDPFLQAFADQGFGVFAEDRSKS